MDKTFRKIGFYRKMAKQYRREAARVEAGILSEVAECGWNCARRRMFERCQDVYERAERFALRAERLEIGIWIEVAESSATARSAAVGLIYA